MEKVTLKKKEKQLEFKKEFSAGGVVYKKQKKNILWLITKSAPSKRILKSVWRLPKGWVDDDSQGGPGVFASGKRRAKENDLKKAALREVEEEGGAKVKIIEKLGTINFFFTLENNRVLKFVTYYLMKWEKNLEEGFGPETKEASFFPYEVARQKLKYQSEKEILDKAKKALDSGVQENLV